MQSQPVPAILAEWLPKTGNSPRTYFELVVLLDPSVRWEQKLWYLKVGAGLKNHRSQALFNDCRMAAFAYDAPGGRIGRIYSVAN